MPIEQITKEGDFVIQNSNGVVSFRMHMTDDAAIISDDRRPGSQLIMTIEEAAELCGWLTRQLSAAI